MKLYQRILICGAARQGNTLLLHLMGAGFRGVRILHGEQVPNGETSRPGQIIVGKRPGEIEHVGLHCDLWDLGFIFTIRDPRDVICSIHTGEGYWVRPDRWVRAAEAIQRHRDHPRAMIVRYEELIRQPARVQGCISKKFGLAFRLPFSKCHRDFDVDDTEGIHAMHGARPLDRSRIGHSRKTGEKRQLVADALRDVPDVEFWMREFGYER